MGEGETEIEKGRNAREKGMRRRRKLGKPRSALRNLLFNACSSKPGQALTLFLSTHTVRAGAHTGAFGQGVVFAVVGFAAALVGTVMSNGLIALRSRLDKNFKSQNKPPNVVLNAGTWAAHMGVSANLRYQMINGLDMVCRSPQSLSRPFNDPFLEQNIMRCGALLLPGLIFFSTLPSCRCHSPVESLRAPLLRAPQQGQPN